VWPKRVWVSIALTTCVAKSCITLTTCVATSCITLTTCVAKSCITPTTCVTENGKFVEGIFKKRSAVLTNYLDNRVEREESALIALEELMDELEHPAGMWYILMTFSGGLKPLHYPRQGCLLH